MSSDETAARDQPAEEPEIQGLPRPAPEGIEKPESHPRGAEFFASLGDLFTTTAGLWALISWIAVYSGFSFNTLLWISPFWLGLSVVGWWWLRRKPPAHIPHAEIPELEQNAQRLRVHRPLVFGLPLLTWLLFAFGAVQWVRSGEGWLLAWGVAIVHLALVAPVTPPVVARTTRILASRKDLVAVSLVAVVGSLLCNYLAVGNWDDAYYLTAVLSTGDYPELPLLSFDGMLGDVSVPIQQLIHRPQTFEVFAALLAKLLYIDPYTSYYAVAPMIFGFMIAIAHWLLFKALSPRSAWLGILFVLAVMLAWGGGPKSWGHFAIPRVFQGKGTFICVFVPLIVYNGIRYTRAPSLKTFLLFMLAQAGGAACTSTALLAGPLAGGLSLLGGWSFSPRQIKVLLIGLLASLPQILVLLAVRHELSVFGKLVTEGTAFPWWTPFCHAMKPNMRVPVALTVLGGLPVLMLFVRAAGTTWMHRYVSAAFLILLSGEVTGWLGEHVAALFSWRMLWAIPMPGLIALAFGLAVHHIFSFEWLRRRVWTGVVYALFVAALIPAFVKGGPDTRKQYFSLSGFGGGPVGWSIPKIPDVQLAKAKQVAEHTRPDSLVLAQSFVSVRLSGLPKEDRPRLIWTRDIYLDNLARHWGKAETRKRKLLARFVQGDMSKYRLATAWREINKRCIDVIQLKGKARKGWMHQRLWKEHFVQRAPTVWVRTDEAHQACLEGELDLLPPGEAPKRRRVKRKKAKKPTPKKPATPAPTKKDTQALAKKKR